MRRKFKKIWNNNSQKKPLIVKKQRLKLAKNQNIIVKEILNLQNKLLILWKKEIGKMLKKNSKKSKSTINL